MGFGATQDRRRQSARAHTARTHTCRCGRQVRGNAYHAHRRACPSWLNWAWDHSRDSFNAAVTR